MDTLCEIIKQDLSRDICTANVDVIKSSKTTSGPLFFDLTGITDKHQDKIQEAHKVQKLLDGYELINSQSGYYTCPERCPGNREADSGLINVYRNSKQEYLLCVQHISRNKTGIHTTSVINTFLEIPINIENLHLLQEGNFQLYDDAGPHFGPSDRDYYLVFSKKHQSEAEFLPSIFKISHDFLSIEQIDVTSIEFGDQDGSHPLQRLSCEPGKTARI